MLCLAAGSQLVKCLMASMLAAVPVMAMSGPALLGPGVGVHRARLPWLIWWLVAQVAACSYLRV